MKLSDLVIKSNEKPAKNVVYDKDWNVSFDLLFVSKPELQKIMGRNTKVNFNPRTHAKDDELDPDKFREDLIHTCVKNWHGVTFKWIATQMLIDLDKVEDANKEVEFNTDNLNLLFKESFGLDSWIIETVRNAANFTEVVKEAEIKN